MEATVAGGAIGDSGTGMPRMEAKVAADKQQIRSMAFRSSRYE
jgi:hypothetical protein